MARQQRRGLSRPVPAGLFDGQGSLTTNGSYTGGFKQGRRDGEGTLKERHDLPRRVQGRPVFRARPPGNGRRQPYQGQFAHGKPNGEGQRGDASGNQFSGHFVNGQLEGNGTFNSADGDIYVGGSRTTNCTARAAMKTPTATCGSASSRKAR
jgi:hypothetical protein